MADYKQKEIDLSLYNVKTITSLSYINNISDNVLNNSYAVFAYDDERDNRYVSHKVKFSDIINKSTEKALTYVDVLKDEFTYFMNNLDLKTSPVYFKIVKHPIDNGFDSLTDKRTGYEFIITPQFASISEDTNSYVVSYIPPMGDNTEGTYTYFYSSYVNPGFVNHEVLQEYIDNTIERILGAPNTPERYDEAINTIQEFVDWFQGYTNDDEYAGSLQHLIDTIEAKDNDIINYANNLKELSYNYTDDAVNNIQIGGGTIRDIVQDELSNYDVTYTAPIGYAITGITQTNGILSAYSYALLGNTSQEIRIDDDPNHSTLTINGVQYKLTINGDGELGFSQYTAINLTNVTSTKTFEYNSGSQTFTVSAKTTKDCTVTNRWEDSSTGNSYSANTVISASVTSFGNTSYNLIVKETDTQEATATATVNVYYNLYKVYVFCSSDSDINTVLTTVGIDSTANQPTSISSNGKTATISSIPSSGQPVTSFTISSPGYLYFLLPTSLVNSSKSIKWRGDEGLGDTPGSARTHTVTLYNNSVNYTLFKSEGTYSDGTISLKYN